MEGESFVLNCNRLATDYLRFGQNEDALKLLKKALKSLSKQEKTSNNTRLTEITLNNLGGYYKKLNNPDRAILYLKRALDHNKNSTDGQINKASTLLNI